MDSNAYCQALVGQRLEHLEKKDYTWFFTFSDQTKIATEAQWRFIDSERIVVSSDDHGHPFGLPAPVDAVEWVLERIGGKPIVVASIASKTGDLSIEFEGGYCLEFLQLSGGYESWRLDVDGTQTICTGGGEIVHFPKLDA